MYAILGIIKVKAAHLAEFVDHVRRHAEHSVREPGCLRFDVLQDAEDPQTICLYEVFRSEADLHAHRAQDYYQRWMAALPRLAGRLRLQPPRAAPHLPRGRGMDVVKAQIRNVSSVSGAKSSCGCSSRLERPCSCE